MSKQQWKRNETKRKFADTQINLGEKFFYAAYLTPLIVLIKYGITWSSSIASATILGFFTFIGVTLLQKGWENYDKLKDE